MQTAAPGVSVIVPPRAVHVEHAAAESLRVHSGRLAVASSDRELSHRELDRLAEAVAGQLRAVGVSGGDLVALAAPRSVAMVAGALGILRTGAAYVALDPSHPAERLAFMLRDCGAKFVVESSPDGLTPVVRPAESAEQRSAADDTHGLGETQVAYVIYTSGSTGSPKAVAVGHESLRNLVDWHIGRFAVTEDDRATLLASPGFDASVWEMWPYLLTGASLHIPPDHVRLDPVALRDFIVEQRITIAFVPTALAEPMTRLAWPPDVALRYLLTGGDVLMGAPPAGLGFVVVNNYGVTEATVVTTSAEIAPSATGEELPPIGFPVAGAELHVVDGSLRPVADGDPGELLIGGVPVALGYLDRPELNTERFIPDHLGSRSAGRLYRTGDLVRLRPDGQFEFLGRLDDQVKIGGARVECKEVAAALLRHADISECVVTVKGDDPLERRLVAYVVAASERPVDVTALRAHLGASLPAFMVPATFVWIDALPITERGKVDRAALPVPAPLSHGTAEGGLAGTAEGGLASTAVEGGLASTAVEGGLASTAVEGAISDIVAELLGLPAVGLQEDFFLLGGHSLFAAQLIAMLSDHFGVDVSLRAVFDGPSVRELAAEVERQISSQLDAMSDEEAEQLLAQIAGEG